MNEDLLRRLAESLQSGNLSLDQFLQSFAKKADESDLCLDFDRKDRCGYPEVIFGQGKTVKSLLQAAKQLIEKQQDVLITRLEADAAIVLQEELKGGTYHPIARTFRYELCRPADGVSDSDAISDLNHELNALETVGHVTVVTAGTTDIPVAEEARQTLEWMKVGVKLIADVGVAGPHRLVKRAAELRTSDVVVVVAGMEGALPSVVAGYVDCPVIGVPTSVGYGTSFGGLTALLSMLNSCSANVSVVNIDAGFKAGYLAGMIAKRTARSSSESSQTVIES